MLLKFAFNPATILIGTLMQTQGFCRIIVWWSTSYIKQVLMITHCICKHKQLCRSLNTGWMNSQTQLPRRGCGRRCHVTGHTPGHDWTQQQEQSIHTASARSLPQISKQLGFHHVLFKLFWRSTKKAMLIIIVAVVSQRNLVQLVNNTSTVGYFS